MSDPVTDNKTASAVNSGIDFAGGTIVSAVEGLIIADVPALSLPIIKQLWEALFGWVAGYFIKAAKTGATFAIIDSQINGEVTTLSKALAAIAAAQKTGDEDALKKAIQDYANAHSALAHSDGSASVG